LRGFCRAPYTLLLSIQFWPDPGIYLRNNIIESFYTGICSESSAVEIDSVHFKCHSCVDAFEESEMKIKKSLFQEEPNHCTGSSKSSNTEPATCDAFPLIYAEKSTLFVEDSIIGSNVHLTHVITAVDSRLDLKNSSLIQKDSNRVIKISEGAIATIDNNIFHFKKQQRKHILLVSIDKNVSLVMHKNTIQDLDDILKKGIEVFVFSCQEVVLNQNSVAQ
jgi:hypothetical protein